MSAHDRRVINPSTLPRAPGWSHGVQAGGWVFGGSMMASDYATGLLPQARPDVLAPWAVEPLELEAEVVLDAAGAVIDEVGGDIRQDLIRVWQWMVASYPDDADYAATRAHWPAFASGTPYARKLATMVGDPLRSSTGIGVRQLAVPGAMLALDFIAVEPTTGSRKTGVVLPDDLPQPKIGYSPAVRYGDWVFLAGFGATDFKGDWMASSHMGEPSMVAPEARVNPYIWLGSEIEAQTRYTLSIMARIAEAAGSSLGRCVKADVTLTHPSDFAGMDRVWREFFPDDPPARTVVTGSQLVIKGLRIEVSLVLLADDADVDATPVHVDSIPLPLGHAPQAVHAGDLLFTSSLLPVDMDGRVPEEMRVDPSAPHFRQSAMRQTAILAERVGALCDAVGSSSSQVCKVQTFLSDLSHLPGMMSAWSDAFPVDPPALSSVGMGGPDRLLAPGACVQWDVIAYAPRTTQTRSGDDSSTSWAA